MARAYTVWLVVKNGKPDKAFTVKHEAKAWLEEDKGWNIRSVWRLPDGKYPLFAPKEMTVPEFMQS